MTYDPGNSLSPQAQFIRDKWSGDAIAQELYRITNGQTDWRTNKSEQAQADWNNGPMQGPPGRAYAEYLKEALTAHPDAPRLKAEADRVLTPAGGNLQPGSPGKLTSAVDTGKVVRMHPPRVRG